MTQSKLLAKCLKLLVDSKCCPDTLSRKWLQDLLYAHSKGWLYVRFEKDEVVMCAAAYRVPMKTKELGSRWPRVELGHKLYIPFCASKSNNRMILLSSLKQFLRDNPDVDEVIFHYRNSDDLVRRYEVLKKGVAHGAS